MERVFFFVETKREIKQRFPYLYGSLAPKPSPAQIRAGLKDFTKLFGWVPVLIRIAESKLFDKAGKTSIEAAGEASLYEAFAILNFKNAESVLQNRTQEEAAKEARRKR